MKSDYLNALLSKLKPKQQTRVEDEVSDHILLRRQEYFELGYNEDISFKKADEHMGDAAVAAEQFSAINKERDRRKYILWTLFTVLFLLMIVYLFLDIRHSYFSLYDYALISFCQLAFLVLALFGFQYKYYTLSGNSILGFWLFYKRKNYLYNLLLSLCSGRSLYQGFIRGGYGEGDALKGALLNQSRVNEYLPYLLLVLVFLCATLDVRRKNLKTSKTDLRLLKGLKITVCSLLTVVSLTFVWTAVNTAKYYQSAKAEAYFELAECREALKQDVNTDKAKSLQYSFCHVYKEVQPNTYTVELYCELLDGFGRQVKTPYDEKAMMVFDEKAVERDFLDAYEKLKKLPLYSDLAQYERLSGKEGMKYNQWKEGKISIYSNSTYQIIVQRANKYFPLRKYVLYNGDTFLNKEDLQNVRSKVRLQMSREQFFQTYGKNYAFEDCIGANGIETVGLYYSTGEGWIKEYY